jgi:hypothetical protein
MQDRYVGDIGDFGKYSLLRALAADDLRLGVVWYLNGDVETNNDGGFTSYLDNPAAPLRACDPPLFDALRILVRDEDCSVRAVRQRRLLPARTAFHDTPLLLRELPPPERRAQRASWCLTGLDATANADLVFFDPDNGIAGRSARRGDRTGAKYVFVDELTPYLARHQSLVVYHHQGRHGTVDEQARRWLETLVRLPGVAAGWGLTFRRQQVRTYFVVATEPHASMLRERTARFLEGPWGAHFRQAGSVA